MSELPGASTANQQMAAVSCAAAASSSYIDAHRYTPPLGTTKTWDGPDYAADGLSLPDEQRPGPVLDPALAARGYNLDFAAPELTSFERERAEEVTAMKHDAAQTAWRGALGHAEDLVTERAEKAALTAAVKADRLQACRCVAPRILPPSPSPSPCAFPVPMPWTFPSAQHSGATTAAVLARSREHDRHPRR